MCGRGSAGHAWPGVCVARGTCMAGVVCVAGETATAADGGHPTGMLSCCIVGLPLDHSQPFIATEATDMNAK